MGSRRAITGVECVGEDAEVAEDGGEVVGEEGGGVLKSQRPRRRKQDGQVAMPGTGDVASAVQPRRARVRALGLIVGGGGEDWLSC